MVFSREYGFPYGGYVQIGMNSRVLLRFGLIRYGQISSASLATLFNILLVHKDWKLVLAGRKGGFLEVSVEYGVN